MGFWNKYPYTDFHELNLDWILKNVKALGDEIDNFEAVNKITFAGEWDITDQYGPWTIVNYNDNGYLSIKAVPAGIPLTNTDYWVHVANYTSIIADLQNRVVDLEAADVAIRAHLTALKSEIESVENRFSDNIVLIGDSYGTTNGSGEATITPYPIYLQDFLDLDNNHYHGAFRNGAGFANGRFTELLNSLSSDDTVTELYVFGGWNDTQSRVTHSDVLTGMNAFTALARSKFPNAKLYLGMLCYSYNTTLPYLNDFADLAQNVYGICTEHGFDGFLNSFPAAVQAEASFWVSTTSSSGMGHPSTEGSYQIAKRLATLINTKQLNFYHDCFLTFTAVDGVTVTGSGESLRQSNNGRIIETFNPANTRINITFDEPTQINSAHGGSYIKIADINDCISIGRQYMTTFIGHARCTVSNVSGYTEIPIEFSIHNKAMFIRSMYGSVANVTAIYLQLRGVICCDPYNA